MQRNLLIADRLRRTVFGPMWHGDALNELLEGVTAQHASKHSVPGGHSIWELVLHMAAWADIARSRLSWHSQPDPTAQQDWPTAPSAVDESAWQEARDALSHAYMQLADSAQPLTDAQLDATVPGRGYTAADMLLGVVEHGAYHGGQIGLLRRALAGG